MGPFHRDGSHYLFMVLNLLGGQPPYWAQFETKNPGVELFWFIWDRLFGVGDVVRGARAAEAVYVATTGAMIGAIVMTMASELTPRISVKIAGATAVGLATTYLLSDWRVTDNGFNTALYQSLVEGACVLVAWSVAKMRIDVVRGGLCIGVLCFLGWFVKQSSLVCVGMPLLLAATHRPRLGIRVAIAAAVAFAIPLVIFGVHLWITDTWPLYKAGTITYNELRFSLFDPGFAQRFEALLLFGSWVGIRSWLRWASLLTILTGTAWVIASIVHLRSRSFRRMPLGLGMVTLWSLGVLAQAVLPGTFFAHYWLALIGPCAAATVLFTIWLLPESVLATCALAAASVITAVATILYGQQATVLRTAAAKYPQAIRWQEIRSVVDMSAPVALWGGLMHPWVFAGLPSRYPDNMWWFYIRRDYGRARIAQDMRRKFSDVPPEAFIEMPETYPPEQGLAPFRLSQETIYSWTGIRYCVALDLPPIPGRYGGRVLIWKRCPAEQGMAPYSGAIAMPNG